MSTVCQYAGLMLSSPPSLPFPLLPGTSGGGRGSCVGGAAGRKGRSFETTGNAFGWDAGGAAAGAAGRAAWGGGGTGRPHAQSRPIAVSSDVHRITCGIVKYVCVYTL